MLYYTEAYPKGKDFIVGVFLPLSIFVALFVVGFWVAICCIYHQIFTALIGDIKQAVCGQTLPLLLIVFNGDYRDFLSEGSKFG